MLGGGGGGFAEGGQAFVNKFVDDVSRYMEFSREPIFIVQTHWYTNHMADMFRSMGIQWQPSSHAIKDNERSGRWHIISAPIRLVPLSQILNGAPQGAQGPQPGGQPGGPEGQKRVFCFDKNDDKKLSYYLDTDDELVELIKSSFELELWTSGQAAAEDGEFECQPKLYTVAHTKQLKRVYCNIYTFAQSLNDWEHMIRCFVKIMKLLTGQSKNTADQEDQNVGESLPKTKRRRTDDTPETETINQ